MKNLVTESINNTLRDPEGQEWLNGIYKKISIEGGAGSYLPMTPHEVEEVIKNASWEVEAILPGKAVLVSRGIAGYYGMMCLEDLPDNEKLLVGKYHGERPQLGLIISDDFPGTPTDELRAVCGVQGGDGTFLITVFPGPNIAPEAIEAPGLCPGQIVTVKEAKRLGASFCKVVRR